MIRLLTLILSVLVVLNLQLAAQPAMTVAARPVEATVPSPREDIQFIDFTFQQPQVSHVSVHYRPIPDAEPTAGERYGVEAVLGGQEQIGSLVFAMVDEGGKPVQRLPMAVHATGADYEFLGLVIVPSYPFRVAVSGERTNGQAFARVFPRLFRPVSTPPGPAVPPGLPADIAEAFTQMIDRQSPEVIAERQALVAKSPTGMLVMPRVNVYDPMYEPLLSGQGPVGMRITYAVRFSETGRYNPGLHVYAQDPGDNIIGRNPMNVRLSTISPAPRLPHAPSEYADTFRVLMSQLADFLYEADTAYSFTVELVPNFVSLERVVFTPCLSMMQRFLNLRDPQAAFERLKNDNGPVTYRVSIGHRAFEGKVDGFYAESAMYRTFVADQTPPCAEGPPQP
jgi:hypothetical protein